MNNSVRLFFRLFPFVLLLGCVREPPLNEFSGDPLPSCSAENTPFGKDDKGNSRDFAEYKEKGKPPEYRWPDIYDERLKKVVDEYEKTMLANAEPGDASNTIRCSAATYAEMLPAGKELKELADELEAFKDRTDKLSILDTTAVLAEWLRVYECAMKEHTREGNATPLVTKELRQEYKKNGESGEPSYTEVGDEVRRRTSFVQNELITVRAMHERLVTLIGGFSRLSALSAELGCLERASADIRNSMSLIAETSACLPRALDIKNSLRDYSLQNQ